MSKRKAGKRMTRATCHTEGCVNQGLEVPLDFIPEGEEIAAVVCGACGQTITDVA